MAVEEMEIRLSTCYDKVHYYSQRFRMYTKVRRGGISRGISGIYNEKRYKGLIVAISRPLTETFRVVICGRRDNRWNMVEEKFNVDVFTNYVAIATYSRYPF